MKPKPAILSPEHRQGDDPLVGAVSVSGGRRSFFPEPKAVRTPNPQILKFLDLQAQKPGATSILHSHRFSRTGRCRSRVEVFRHPKKLDKNKRISLRMKAPTAAEALKPM